MNTGQVRHVGVRAGLLQRKPAIAVGQRHFRAGEAVVHPLGVAEQAGGAGVDGVAVDVDLAGAFPLSADGGVGQAGVAGGHGVAGVVEQPAHDLLGDVVVDQPGGVAELVRGDPGRAAQFVGDSDGGQPLLEVHVEGVGADRVSPVGVGVRAWEQHVGVGVLCASAALLVGDLGGELFVDGHDRLAAHLVVEVAQVSRCGGVVDEAVDPKAGGVADPEPGADQDLDQQSDARVADAVEVGRGFELVHHEFRDCP